MEYEPVIGLEVHAQLLTESKIFCGCSTQFGAPPNSHVCPVCMGAPGALPVLNRRAVEMAVRMGLAVGAEISPKSLFARKNYFYPDLPKGYQISQYEGPLCIGGGVTVRIDGAEKRIRLNRIHLEEDAGKSIHPATAADRVDSYVDLNRCGVPLIEIVSEPDISSPEEAYSYLINLKQILKYLDICDGNMEQGSLRCDANISVRPKGQTALGVKTEVKNMNSFRGVERALAVEVDRQVDLLEAGGKVEQETLLWDENRSTVRPMRSKEYAHDYRYFPDPDLVVVVVSPEWIERIGSAQPELPERRYGRFIEQYGLSEYDASVLTSEKEWADYFEAMVGLGADAKWAANWLSSEVLAVLRERKIDIRDFPVKPDRLASLHRLIADGTISGKIAKSVFQELIASGGDPESIIRDKGLVQISDRDSLEETVRQVLAENPDEAERCKAGETKLKSFFVGQVMRLTGGQANPRMVNRILDEELGQSG